MFLTLSYHSIDRTILDAIAISEEAFEAQLDYLREHDYHALTLEQAIDDIDGRSESPPRSVLLTFDDGYADNVQVALPLLRKYDMKAALFVVSAYVGQNNRWNPKACYDTRHAIWDELRSWLASGCAIGGHTHHHLCMTRLNRDELQETVRVNKRLLEEQLHVTPRAFAYPYGRFTQAALDVVRQHYQIAFTVEKGSWDAPSHRYAINRMMVYPHWSHADFIMQLQQHFALAHWVLGTSTSR